VGRRSAAAWIVAIIAAVGLMAGTLTVFHHRSTRLDLNLFQALQRGDLITARDLIQKDARWDPLLLAIRRSGRKEALSSAALHLSLMWRYDSKSDGYDSLSEDPVLVRTLLEMGAVPDANMLYLAVSQDKRVTARLLIAAGAEVDKPQPDGETALMWAAYCGDTGLVSSLLDRGATIDRQDSAGWTPLVYAIWSDQVAAVRFLLSRGADPTRRTKDYGTCLDVANSRPRDYAGKAAIVQMMKEASATRKTWRTRTGSTH
jgi:ankyrin repeat protein